MSFLLLDASFNASDVTDDDNVVTSSMPDASLSPASYCETSDDLSASDESDAPIIISSDEDSDMETANDVIDENRERDDVTRDESAHQARRQPEPIDQEVRRAASLQQSKELGMKCRNSVNVLKKFPAMIEVPMGRKLEKLEKEILDALEKIFDLRGPENSEEQLEKLKRSMTNIKDSLLSEVQKLNSTPVDVVKVNILVY